MNADCAFAIGASHAICQDYARTAGSGGRISAWLADGCSSSPDTDWGARLLVQAAIRYEREFLAGDLEGFVGSVARSVAETTQSLCLAPESLDATLLGIVVDENTGVFRVLVYGDGVAVLGRRDGSCEVRHIEYARNYPLYLSYRNNPARAACWTADTTNERITTTSTPPTDVAVETAACRTGEPTVLEGQIADFQYAMLFSDGVTSFTRRDPGDVATPQPCSYRDILPELTAIKSWRGAFVQRRLQRFLRDASARGLRHQDDLAMAAVYFGE